MYRASKSYLAASVSALALAIVMMLVAITAWSLGPEAVADTSGLAMELKKSLPP